jgi:hypothetical protein
VIREDLLHFCAGNKEAVALIEGFWGFMEAWDDIIDRDKPPDDEATNKAILWALFDLHDNVFYKAFPGILRGAIQQAVVSWLTANKFECSGKRELVEQAYFMRCSAYDVFSLIALLAGGPEKHMAAVEYFRSLAPDDTLASYLREHLEGGAKSPNEFFAPAKTGE